MVANGPRPPLDTVIGTDAATGAIVPSAERTRVVSTGTHPRGPWTNRGSALISRVNVPSGLAVNVDVDVRSETTSCAVPATFA